MCGKNYQNVKCFKRSEVHLVIYKKIKKKLKLKPEAYLCVDNGNFGNK